MSTKDLQAKIKELKELQRMAEEIKYEIESIQDEIKQEMTARKTDELTTNEYKIKWTPTETARFDSKAFKADHSKMYEKYLKVTSSRRFSIV